MSANERQRDIERGDKGHERSIVIHGKNFRSLIVKSGKVVKWNFNCGLDFFLFFGLERKYYYWYAK
jgi:hypothetical protein